MTLSDAARAQIEAHLDKSRVVLFMKGSKHFPQCGFSSQVVKILSDVGVPFETVNVLSSQDLREGIKAYTDWPTIPQLYVDKKFVGGCDIVKDLYASGELAELLGATPDAPVAPTIRVSAAARAELRAADDGSGDTVRLEIGAEFNHDLYVGPKEPGDVEVDADGVLIRMDKATARRADGLVIDWVAAQGGAFRLDNPNEPPRVRGLSVEGLKAMLDAGDAVSVWDVRGDGERALASLSFARPLTAESEDALLELDRGTRLVFFCHHGGRSRGAAEHFLRQGFSRVYNLEGGIDAWAQRIDPTVERY